MGTSTDVSSTRTGRLRAQSDVVGLVLVLGMVLAGTAAIVTLGASALGDTQTQSELERAEHTLTLLNSRTSMVALGDSEQQTVSFGQDSGQLRADPDAGWLRITHYNYSGDGDDEVIFNNSLGAVTYENNNVEMAYQGGGVWRQPRQGASRMVSPPEFHYRGATLTLPIIRVGNDASGGGGSTARIVQGDATRLVYPNTTTSGGSEVGAPYNVTGEAYGNPVGNGTVNVTIKSDYYEGWAEYFRQRTDGDIDTFPDDNRVRIGLITLAGSIGPFEVPSEGNGLGVRGMADDHPVDDFGVELVADNPNGKDFNNMHWSWYADEGNEQFELHFYSDGQCTGSGYNGALDVSVYYYNASGSDTIHEEWQRQGIVPSEPGDPANDDFHLDCDTGTLSVDLIDSTATELEYGDITMTGSNNKWWFGPEIGDRDITGDTTSFGPHASDSGSITQGASQDMDFVLNHYLDMIGPRFELTVTDGPGGSSRIDEGASEGVLDYETGGAQYITYLHVTENEVNVDLG